MVQQGKGFVTKFRKVHGLQLIQSPVGMPFAERVIFGNGKQQLRRQNRNAGKLGVLKRPADNTQIDRFLGGQLFQGIGAFLQDIQCCTGTELFKSWAEKGKQIFQKKCRHTDGEVRLLSFGEVLADMANQVGMVCAEFDPHSKYFKPAGFGNPPAAHYEYIDLGRRPWHYRSGGSAIARPDCWMSYPRVCAHRGYTAAGPENSLAALAAAVAMGAEEIEFDLWSTTDGEFVVVHDENLERLSNGTGKVWEHSYEELKALDFGTKPGYEGLKVTTFEEILKKLSCHAVMNIHLKTPDGSLEAYDEAQLQKMIDLIYKYDCTKHVYIMTGNDTVLKQLKGMAPWLQLCCGGGARPWDIVDRAIEIGCQKVQLFKPYFNQEMVDKAHAHGIRCNVFYADDPEEAKQYLEMGIDTILTNNYRVIAKTVEQFEK